ncbi:MAG: hypothetical protein LBL79_07360 [Prevotella sp.]|jgi:hypothetical protein|nr:hypothetical protein [Prevotella sp.]
METVTVKQIHNAFDLASDALLVIREDNFPKKEAIKEKAERLKKLGFSRCSEVIQFEGFDRDREDQLKLLENQRTAHEFAQKYREKYPDIKFITQKQLGEICEKYNLVAKSVSEYVGDIPEQKLFEMEYWLDEIEDADIPDDTFQYTLSVYDKDLELKIERDRERHERETGRSSYYIAPHSYYLKYFRHEYEGKTHLSESEPVKTFKGKGVLEEDILMSNITMNKNSNSGLMIAAPESMFRTPQKNLDPIVLRPVNGGYLVVAKWGEEANDPALTVPEMN